MAGLGLQEKFEAGARVDQGVHAPVTPVTSGTDMSARNPDADTVCNRGVKPIALAVPMTMGLRQT